MRSRAWWRRIAIATARDAAADRGGVTAVPGGSRWCPYRRAASRRGASASSWTVQLVVCADTFHEARHRRVHPSRRSSDSRSGARTAYIGLRRSGKAQAAEAFPAHAGDRRGVKWITCGQVVRDVAARMAPQGDVVFHPACSLASRLGRSMRDVRRQSAAAMTRGWSAHKCPHGPRRRWATRSPADLAGNRSLSRWSPT